MDACQRVQLAQVSWVKNKYSVAAPESLWKQDNKDDPQRLQELTAF